MFYTFRIPVTWREILQRTVKEFSQDDVLGLAAQMAYYFLFALAPAIVCVLAITSYVPFSSIQDLVAGISGFAPPDVAEILRDQLANLAEGQHTGALTFGFLLALWSSSAAMVSIISALNRAYDIEEARPWWKVRLTAIALTVGVAIFIVLAFALVLVGPTFIDRVVSVVGLGPAFATVWNVARWMPGTVGLVTVGSRAGIAQPKPAAPSDIAHPSEGAAHRQAGRNVLSALRRSRTPASLQRTMQPRLAPVS